MTLIEQLKTSNLQECWKVINQVRNAPLSPMRDQQALRAVLDIEYLPEELRAVATRLLFKSIQESGDMIGMEKDW